VILEVFGILKADQDFSDGPGKTDTLYIHTKKYSFENLIWTPFVLRLHREYRRHDDVM